MPNGMSVKNRRDDKLDKRVNVARAITKRRAKVDQLTERIDVEVERKRILKFTNVNGTLEIEELETEHNLRDISWRESRPSQFYESRILSASHEVPTEQSGLNSSGARTTRYVEHGVPFLRETVDDIPSHRRLPEVRVRESLLKGMSVTRVTSRVDIDLLIELGRLNEF
jgi:hypothetical protein